MRKKTRVFGRAAAVLIGAGVMFPGAFAQSANQHWIPTWAASPQPRAGGPARAPQAGAKGTAPAPAQLTSFNNQTVRMVVPTSIGGSRVRVEFSNAYGTSALTIGEAHIAIYVKAGVIEPESDRQLKFGGKESFSIPPGAVAVSDPVGLAVPKLGELAVSVYFPQDTGPLTMHNTGLHTTYILAGDAPGVASFSTDQTTRSWYFLSSVDVTAPANAGLIVAFGDSITDGATSTTDANASWPSQLATRLAANPATANLAIVNQGISGNRVCARAPPPTRWRASTAT